MMRTSVPAEIPTVDCHGDPWTMGVQQGEALSILMASLGEELAEALRMPAAGGFMGGVFEYARRQVIPLVSRGMAWTSALSLSRRLNSQTPDQAARLAGIVDGSGVNGGLAHLSPLLELAFGAQASAGCTTVAIGPQRSATGEPMLVKNLDASPHRLTPYVVRRNHPVGKLKDLDLADPGMAGCLDGVNEAGLALCCNHRIHPTRPQPRVPLSFLCKALLETCRTVDEAIETIARWPATRPALILLLDRQGAIATVDITDQVAVHRHDGMAIHTNHGPRLVRTSEAASEPKNSSSARRYARMTELLGDEGVTLDALKRALADHEDAPSDLSICRHGPHLATRCSVIFFPMSGAMEILKGAPCTGVYVPVSPAHSAAA